MRRLLILLPVIVVLSLVMLGCSSSDPTASDEYVALEQELVESEARLVEITAELGVLLEEVDAAAEVAGEADESAVPDDIAALTEAWGEAVNSGGGAVTDLYQAQSCHLYGAQRIAYDDIAGLLEVPTADGEWLTEPYLLVNRSDELYVVARGAMTAGTHLGPITFVIARAPDGVPEIASTAWVLARS